MARDTRAVRDPHQKEIVKLFSAFDGSKNRRKIFEDFLAMTACMYSNIADREHYEEREKLYHNIEVGDLLVLREWTGEKYTGREIYADVTYVLRDVPEYGLKEGYCIFGMRPLLPCPYISRNLCDEEETMK